MSFAFFNEYVVPSVQYTKIVKKQGVPTDTDNLEFVSHGSPEEKNFAQTPGGTKLTGGLGSAFDRNLDLQERATTAQGRANARRANEGLMQRAAPRAAAVAASRASQRNTNAINSSITSGRKKVRSASSALPRIPSGLLLGEDKRNLLL